MRQDQKYCYMVGWLVESYMRKIGPRQGQLVVSCARVVCQSISGGGRVQCGCGALVDQSNVPHVVRVSRRPRQKFLFFASFCRMESYPELDLCFESAVHEQAVVLVWSHVYAR